MSVCTLQHSFLTTLFCNSDIIGVYVYHTQVSVPIMFRMFMLFTREGDCTVDGQKVYTDVEHPAFYGIDNGN